MKIDAHQHFWQYNDDDYGWMSGETGILRSNHLPDDLWQAQKRIGFDGSVAVQARQTLEETHWLLSLANLEPRIKGVVGWIDLASNKVDIQLAQFGTHPKLVGVRHVVQDEPDDEFMLRPEFLEGIRKLKRYNLVYDLLLYEKHLPVAIKVVRDLPEQTFVLDHISKPLIKDRVLSPWDANLSELASFPNVSCKLSGMVTEADWASWKPEDLAPYMDIALEAFGPERLMIGSDWPVCRVAGEYERVMQCTIDYLKKLSKKEQVLVLGDNCRRIYELNRA
ncbi:MAG TPA: amidohydrolase [Candidatus Hydrogenedentes bacterium]|nr:amidohydrolase [Candidatus Hydrogenedentota bacterium]